MSIVILLARVRKMFGPETCITFNTNGSGFIQGVYKGAIFKEFKSLEELATYLENL